MTDVDPHRCPDCAAPLTGGATCPACGLLLTGPSAVRLWEVSTAIVRLRDEREALLRALRPPARQAGTPVPPPVPQAPPAPRASAAPVPPWEAAVPAPPWETGPTTWGTPSAPRPRREWTTKRVQNLLLVVGAVLLVTSATAFTALHWSDLGIGVRGAIMLAATGIAGYAAHRLHRRGLSASAESVALIAVLFGVVDAYAARRAGLVGRGGDAATYWTFASAVLAALSAAFGRVVPVRSVRYAALLGAQVPLALTAARLDGWPAGVPAALLVGQAAALAAGARYLRDLVPAARVSAVANWSAGALVAVLAAYGSHDRHDVRIAAAALLLAAAVTQFWPGDREWTLSVATAAFVLAAVAPARIGLTGTQLPAAIAATGLLAVLAAASLPRGLRRGVTAVGGATVGIALGAVAPYVVTGFAQPLGWVVRPWRLTGDPPVRTALSFDEPWRGTVVTLGVVAAATAAVVIAAEALERRAQALWWTVGLGSVAVVLTPLGFAWTYRQALAWDVTFGVLGLALAVVLRRWVVAVPATAVLGVATALSLASETATLVVLLAVTLAYAGFAAAYDVTRDYAAAVAASGAAAYAVAVAASRGAPVDRVGFVLATAAFSLVLAGTVLGGRTGLVVESVAAVAYVVALGLAATGAGWLAWTLGGGAVVATLSALRPDRRRVAGVAAALAAACAAATSAAYGAPAVRAGFAVALTGCVLVAIGAALRLTDVAVVGGVAYALGLGFTVEDLGWLSWTLAAGAVTAGAAAYWRRVLAPVAAGLALLCVGTTSGAYGNPLDRTGFSVALAAAAAVGVGTLLRGDEGAAVEAIAGAAYAVALLLSCTDPGWLFWVLATGGVTAHALALRPDRRALNWAGLVLLTAASWDRLWIEGVRVPEAYAAPVAAITLVLGHLRRRRDPSVGSWSAYGGGLVSAFGVTTWELFADPGVTRPVLLAVAGVVVLLAGLRERLQAPLTVAAVALAVDGLVQLAPVAAALPKWATIGAAGLLVIAVGVTFEDRRRDVARLRQTFDSLV
jgi:hypothetical protein